MTVDPRAASGFSTAVEAYERGRPSYPAAAVDLLGIRPGDTVLDLAAGSGKLTRRLENRGARVIAVDPSEPMLAALRRRSPTVDVRVGTAHAIPVENASVNVLCVGDAIHWFGDRAAFTEIARVLQPGGRLAVLHHRAAWEVPWAKRLGELLEPLRRQAGAFPHERWEEAMAAVFGTVTRTEIPHTQHVDPDDFVALISSWSWVANVAQAVREPVLADVRRLVGDEVLELPYVTDVAIASRAP